MKPAIPVLRIFDEAKAKEFYRDFLGFAVDWEHRFEVGTPLYLQISNEGSVLHLSEHHGDASPGAVLRIETAHLPEFCAALRGKGYKYSRPGDPAATPWGTREITIADPFGNRLIFYEAQAKV